MVSRILIGLAIWTALSLVFGALFSALVSGTGSEE